MAEAVTGQAAPPDAPPDIDFRNLVWVGAAIVVLVAAILSHERWYLNFVHVMTAVMWTGIDLFMGFVIGPVMRRMGPEARRSFIVRLVPRMLFLMPTLAIVGGTSGWFLAQQMGYFDMNFPQLWWVVAAVAILLVLTVQGLGMLLPTNIRVYRELRKDRPDGAKIGRMMRYYIYLTASQGVMQVAMIVIMARFVTGI